MVPFRTENVMTYLPIPFRNALYFGTVFLSTLGYAQTQVSDSLKQMPQAEMDSLQAKEVDLAQKKDSVVLSKSSLTGRYQLEDHPEAARYDSLWIRELAASATAFDEIYEEVRQLNVDSTVVYDLPTDTLKARLRSLNERTPFNVAYNTSLENVIKSFLTRKRDFLERMLTNSQFYFPMFEQALDNHDIPLEMKYLAIVESALNPKARSSRGHRFMAIHVWDRKRNEAGHQ